MESPYTQTTKFHGLLPGYKPTPLVDISAQVAAGLGVGRVFVKDESNRLGLSAFKILGASWAIFRVLTEKFSLDLDTSLGDPDILQGLRAHVEKFHEDYKRPMELVAATAGNHGRAVARVATLLGLQSHIFVSDQVAPASRQYIALEGAEVSVVQGDYNNAVDAAKACTDEDTESRLLIQDYAIGEYTTIPSWIVDGYATLFAEVDEQLQALGGVTPDAVIVPCGGGVFSHGAVRYLRSPNRPDHLPMPTIILVQASTAGSLLVSLAQGKPTTISTGRTIMPGLNCGTPSSTAFPDLAKGVDVVTAVTDEEALRALEDLKGTVDVGPCGAAPLAAARSLFSGGSGEGDDLRAKLGLSKNSTIVLVSSEGGQMYRAQLALQASASPPDDAQDESLVKISDPVELSQALIRIASPNPELSQPSSSSSPDPEPAKHSQSETQNEARIATFIASWLSHRGFEVHRLEERPGRPSIVGVARGLGGEGAKSLMFNGHIDTVSLAGYNGDSLTGEIVNDDELHGRGAYDMKGGVAAMLVAAASAKNSKVLRGDVIVACVADEEFSSAGTTEILNAGWRADGAIIPEPTDHQVLIAHQGFVWLEVDVLGRAAHGSRADLGVDAIVLAGHFLVALQKYAGELRGDEARGTVHASLIQGGEEPSTYPAKCTITVERRTVKGETPDSVRLEVQEILTHLEKTVLNFKSSLRVGMFRPPFSISPEHPFVALIGKCSEKALGSKPTHGTGLFWADSALLGETGIPAVLFGLKGEGAHASTEWASVKSIRQLTEALTDIALEFCK